MAQTKASKTKTPKDPALVSIFSKYEPKGYPHRFFGTLHIPDLVGATPSDPKIAEAWIRAKGYTGGLKDNLLIEAVHEVMEERGLDEKAAVEEIAKRKHMVGFKRDDIGLYVEGRCLKACIKEAAAVALAADKLPARWGKTHKGLLGYVSEHIFVTDDRLYLGLDEPTNVQQSFVHTWRGNGIQYSEHAEDIEVGFELETDHTFSDQEWAMLWLTAERQGLGGSRSQGYGRFTVTEWKKA